MSDLEEAIKCCVDIFVKYSGKDSDCLNAKEFEDMMGKQIDASNYKGKLDFSDFTEVFKKLDKNSNDEINIQEYARCISLLIKAYYRKERGKSGRKGGRGGKHGGKGEDCDED